MNVNTFEEALEIDIDAISDKLQAVGYKIATIDNTIASFCKELNIKTPF